jgi:hypothetical protein
MTIGASIFLIAVGAALKFAIADRMNGIDLGVIGIIMMLAGLVGLIIAVVMQMNNRRVITGRGVVVDRQTTVRDDNYPPL